MIPILIENLVKSFGATRALDRVSLRIEPGELFFLLGPSGCGKTTLLRSLAGFCPPDSGRILFGETDVTNLPAHKRDTGMMFQSYALWPHLTVAKNVAFGLEERRVPSREIRGRVAAALEAVQMGSCGDRKINQLSGGQQQRVALARALVIRPRCLLLDEPLSNLDARLRLEMRSEIRRVCKDHGLTAVYVTHDQKEALSVADRMAVMESGRVAQIGAPRDVYQRPASRAVADFIGESNFLEGTLESPSAGTVSTAVGTFHGTPTVSGLSAGSPVVLSIRPECWRFELRTENCLEGRVVESTFLGEAAQHILAVGGVRLKILESNPGCTIPSDAPACRVAVDARDVVILPP